MHIGRGTKPPHNLDIELLPLLGLHTTLVEENSNCTVFDVQKYFFTLLTICSSFLTLSGQYYNQVHLGMASVTIFLPILT